MINKEKSKTATAAKHKKFILLTRWKWQEEIPELDLDSLYARIGDLIRKNSPAPKEARPAKKKPEPKPKAPEPEKQKRQTHNENDLKPHKLPDSWNRYTTRAFQKCRPGSNDIEAMQKLLTDEHDNALRTKQMGRNWDEYPLPTLPFELPKSTTVFPREKVASAHGAWD